MCTINMTFEVPETKHINIEALKRQMHSYLEFILSMPNIAEKTEEKKYDMSFFDRFDNDWSDDPRDSHEIAAELHDSFDLLIGSSAVNNGLTIVTHNKKHFVRIPHLQIVDWEE